MWLESLPPAVATLTTLLPAPGTIIQYRLYGRYLTFVCLILYVVSWCDLWFLQRSCDAAGCDGKTKIHLMLLLRLYCCQKSLVIDDLCERLAEWKNNAWFHLWGNVGWFVFGQDAPENPIRNTNVLEKSAMLAIHYSCSFGVSPKKTEIGNIIINIWCFDSIMLVSMAALTSAEFVGATSNVKHGSLQPTHSPPDSEFCIASYCQSWIKASVKESYPFSLLCIL